MKAENYEAAAAALVLASGCTVRKYRKSNTGRAYTHSEDWEISVPRARGPVSFGVFAHEVGHQLLHRDRQRVAWLNEIEAWEFALGSFEKFGLAGVERSRRDAAKHLRYVALKSSRRCSAATAQKILDRYPAWVWVFDDPREAVTSDVLEALSNRANLQEESCVSSSS